MRVIFKIYCAILTALLIVVGIGANSFALADREMTYTGPMINTDLKSDEYYFWLDNPTATVEMRSLWPFTLRDYSGGTINGEKVVETSNLGETHYYQTGPQTIHGGEWQVKNTDGGIVMELTNDNPMRLHIGMKLENRIALVLELSFLLFLFWFFLVGQFWFPYGPMYLGKRKMVTH